MNLMQNLYNIIGITFKKLNQNFTHIVEIK